MLTIRQELLKYQLRNLKYFLPVKTSLASHGPQTIKKVEVGGGCLFVVDLFVLSRYVFLHHEVGHRTITQTNKIKVASCLIHSYKETAAWSSSKFSLSCLGMC